MATVHPIRPREPAEPESVVASLLRLARLELELGLAETRDLLISAVIAAAVALVAGIALIASIVVLVAGALAVGLLLSRVPFVRLVGLGTRVIQTGLAVAPTVALIRRYLAERRQGNAA